MAQLSPDCFATGESILSIENAVAAITARFAAVDAVETVPVADADGRVLADDLVATFPLPPFTNSAVDGYAVRGDDVPVDAPRLFRVAGRLQSGSRRPQRRKVLATSRLGKAPGGYPSCYRAADRGSRAGPSRSQRGSPRLDRGQAPVDRSDISFLMLGPVAQSTGPMTVQFY